MKSMELQAGVSERLQEVLATQRRAFLRHAPDYRQRMDALETLGEALVRHEADIVRAVSTDFGGRASEETRMLELLPLHDAIRHARRNLKRWMRRRRVAGSWFLLPGRAYFQFQPLGVVGVMGAWNFPWLLTLGPAIDAIAAGNHVILKPSEIAPRSADLMAAIVSASFSPDYISCIPGNAELAQAFSGLPLDHLCFTGSTRVGRMVMQAAAANLTPVTLELGGKSPAIVSREYPLRRAAKRLAAAKLVNGGQTCVAPDYVLLPDGLEAAFEVEFGRAVLELYPTLASSPDYTRIVNASHYQRLTTMLEEARTAGARVVTVNPAAEMVSADSRVFAPTLVFGAPDGTRLMQEEIFGPILPVVSYRTLEEAIAYVNVRPRPLALYYFDHDRKRTDRVLRETMSGGVTVNDCIYHLAQHNLPFGGVGPSGMGHYHGFDGFQTFSKKRPLMVQGWLSGPSIAGPPYQSKQGIIRSLLWLSRRIG